MKIFSIVITYNGLHWIEKCLNSLESSDFPTEIIVVDNASTDNTVTIISTHFPSVKIFPSNKNLGFGMANNIGIKYALENGAEYIFFLNQDAWVECDTVSGLASMMQKNRQMGIISPMHYDGSGDNLDLFFKKYLQTSAPGSFENILDEDDSQLRDIIRTNFINAASWLVSRDCLIKTGGFDALFFHYGEDVNFCQRATYLGFEIGIYTRRKIFHDRMSRISPDKITNKSKLSHEWMNFLINAADINRKNYFYFMTKRLSRHILLAALNALVLNGKKIYLNGSMSLKILLNLWPVHQSQIRSLKGGWRDVYYS